MNEPLIPAQTIDTFMPAIPAISNNALNASTSTSMSQLGNLSDYNDVRNNVSSTNTDFESSIDCTPYFIDSDEKNVSATQPTLATPARVLDEKGACLAPT